MNRSGNTGFNGLVFFGNRGDGLFFWRGVRESCCLLLLSLRWFEPKVSNRARQIRIKDTKIPLKVAAARKKKRPLEGWCGGVQVRALVSNCARQICIRDSNELGG